LKRAAAHGRQALQKRLALLEEDVQATVDVPQLPRPRQRLLFGWAQLKPLVLAGEPTLQLGPTRLQTFDLGGEKQPLPVGVCAPVRRSGVGDGGCCGRAARYCKSCGRRSCKNRPP